MNKQTKINIYLCDKCCFKKYKWCEKQMEKYNLPNCSINSIYFIKDGKNNFKKQNIK